MDLETLRHSCSHLLAHAVKELYPKVKLGIGPAIENGFYYDFDKTEPFTPEDLKKIEKKMYEISKRELDIKKVELTKKEQDAFFKKEPYKKELAKEHKAPTFYQQGDFIDLCKGPHVDNTKELKGVYKLSKVAGAYWKGDSSNKQLQRIYGYAFENKQKVKAFMKILEEAEKRDHKKLGKQLDLFSIHEEAPGMPFFHNKGTFIYETIKEYLTQELRALNYELNLTPIILNKKLWLQSGHWDHYQDNMYFTKIDKQDFAVKPMNCPGNILIFKSKLHSYRELPIKAGEYGLVHRHELSGVLNGLFRVRMFTQDDAHIYCTEKQLKDQIIELIDLINRVYSTFGFTSELELSTRPEKAMGSKKTWDSAEKSLTQALKVKKLKYKINKGDGAFYGPKIDFHIKDAIGRSWQCGTIQLDFQMPEKFDLTYEGKDGKKHRPIMLHRTILGSFERFMGVLIEHFAGKFPLWLSPVQVKVLTVTDRANKFAEKVANELKQAGIRVEIDDRSESISKKVREATLEKVNYILTLGDKEVKNKTLAVRQRSGKVDFGVKTKKFLTQLQKEIDSKQIK